jgi:hypothetical protein
MAIYTQGTCLVHTKTCPLVYLSLVWDIALSFGLCAFIISVYLGQCATLGFVVTPLLLITAPSALVAAGL